MASAKPLTVDVDMYIYQQKVAKLLDQIGKDKDLFLNEQGGLLFRDVAKYTPPFANGKLPTINSNTYGTAKDRKAGEGAVVRDVYRSMKPVAPATRWKSPRIQKAIRAKDTEALKAIFQNAEKSAYQGWYVDLFDKKFHRRARNSRGRVTRQKQQLVLPKVKFIRYLKKVKKSVGQGKAYFAWAAMQMGRKSAPAWISRHFYRYKSNVQRTEFSRIAKGAHGAFLHTVRFLPYIIDYRSRSAEKRLLFLTKKAVKNSGLSPKTV